MNEAARILTAIENGDRQAAEQLLPFVYDELRRLAARKLARESPGAHASGHGPGARGVSAAGR
jgi:DNA-binding GntR family transcriptional regulator